MVNISLISIINACKVATLACIIGFAYHFGFQTLRAWIYVALHCTYLAWWFLHQRLSPSWGNTVFGPGDFSIPFILTTFLTVGPGYALPGYYAFKSTDEPQPWLVTASIMLFAWGSLINCAADFYKDGAKSAKPGASVTGGPFRLARHINWFGDWMRYSSFALISGTPPAPLALFPLAWTMLLNLASLQERDARKAKRVADKGDAYLTTTPAVVPWRLLF